MCFREVEVQFGNILFLSVSVIENITRICGSLSVFDVDVVLKFHLKLKQLLLVIRKKSDFTA